MFLVTVLALVIFLKVIQHLSRQSRKTKLGSCNEAPTIPFSQIVRGLFKSENKNSPTWRFIGPLFSKYGTTYKLSSGLRTSIFTSEPENIRAVLFSQAIDFNLGKRPLQFKNMIGPQGVFAAEGKEWAHCRAIMKPQFRRENISHLNMLENHIPLLFQIIRKHNGEVDMQELMLRYTITTGMDFLVGKNLHSLEAYLKDPSRSVYGDETVDWTKPYPFDSDEGCNRFIQAFEHSQRDTHKRIVYYDTYWMFTIPHAKEAQKIIHSYIYHFVDEALAADEEKVRHITMGDKGYVFLYQLLDESRDPVFLHDQILSLLGAARDTTTSLLTWSFFYLSRNREIAVRLRDEIRAAFGTGTEDDIQSLTFDSLRTCKYLRNVLNETLRCSPPVPVNFRAAVKDTTLPSGGGAAGSEPIFVEKGQNVYFSKYHLHRRKDIWGDDAENWNPDRWDALKTIPWSFLPFGGGPRVCVGQQFALTEASYLLVRFFQEFESLECIPGQESQDHGDLEFKHMTTLSMEGGCHVKIK